MTRARFTAMTRCAWPAPPTEGKEIAILFKASGGGERIRENLQVPQGVLLQFQEKGSYRLPDVLAYILDFGSLANRPSRGFEPRQGYAAPKPGKRIIYLLDWFSPHLDPQVDTLIHSAGHAVLRIGGHLTGLVQVEDTHAHGPMTRAYKKLETLEAFEQLELRPDRLPSTSRQTVMDRALGSWHAVNHESCSRGFVSNGIANKNGWV